MIPVIWLINSSYNSNNLLSLGAVSLNRFALRYSLPIFMLALSGSVSAVGLGELRGQPALGERIQLEIDLLGSDTQKLDASCFRLVQPAGGGDFPWLKKATLRVRKGARPVLEIASDTPLREPIVQLAVQVGCGLEVSRDYILLASPQGDTSLPTAERHSQAVESRPLAKVVRKPVRVRSVAPTSIEAPARLAPGRANKPSRDVALPDRLMLSDGGVGDPSLRLATVLMAAPEAQEEQREILRIEYRMLMAMHQQATSQMATAEKLRNMESTLGNSSSMPLDLLSVLRIVVAPRRCRPEHLKPLSRSRPQQQRQSRIRASRIAWAQNRCRPRRLMPLQADCPNGASMAF